jgi:hypothetical protein
VAEVKETDPVVYSGWVHVKPGEGRTVRSPDHSRKPLPVDGDWVNWSVYWERRRIDKDVIVSDPQPSRDSDAGPVPVAPPAPPVPAPPAPAPKAIKSEEKDV